jgi:CBS domain-containing protein
MARYRDDVDDGRDYNPREDRFRREELGAYDEPFARRAEFQDRERRNESGRGRFGERADYENDEPRYSQDRYNQERGGWSDRDTWSDRGDRYRDEGGRNSLLDIRGDLDTGRGRDRYTSERSRLRCRDIMTKDLAVATRDTRVVQVALMMKQEDTGVIPVVDYDVMSGNGRTDDIDRDRDRDRDDRREGRTYSRGKLVGLITDRDIVVRGVADGKDCANTRAEDVMSVDVHSARPNDRVVDVIRKMANKQVRRIPVLNENNYLLGMISMGDIALETHEDRELADALEDISKNTSFWNRVFG